MTARCVLALMLTAACAQRVRAQSPTINVWPGATPGSAQWTQKERVIENTPVVTVVFNVVTPTLTAYLPSRGAATGTGMIIAPGGGFVALAISQEGTDVARWLQRRGTTRPKP